MDIVKQFHTTADKLGYKFTYGTDDILNLIDTGEFDDDKIYLLLQSPIKVNPQKDNFGNTIKTTVNGGIIFGVSSRLEETIYNENDGKISDTQYNKHIVRLYDEIDNIQGEFEDCGIIITKFNSYEVYNLFDANLTALIIDYSFDYE